MQTVYDTNIYKLYNLIVLNVNISCPMLKQWSLLCKQIINTASLILLQIMHIKGYLVLYHDINWSRRHVKSHVAWIVNINGIYFVDDAWTVAGDKDLDGMAFTALDRDNDLSAANCASHKVGCWWYNSCAAGKFSGRWEPHAVGKEYLGIRWRYDYNLQYSALMIKVV